MKNNLDFNYLTDLKQLIIKLELLDRRLVSKKEKVKLLDKLKESYNRLKLYEMYEGKHLIAVTGLQGAGKTMLVRELFELPENILPENNSRGEKIPVFISEGDVDEPSLYRYYISKENNNEIDNEKVSPEKFRETAMSPNEKEDLWLQCIVPPKLLKDDRKIIALLPGFERSKNDFSQKLLDFIVQMSTFSILVMNKNTYARKSTNRLMKKIEKIFENQAPIIALTHGDEVREENETIKNNVIKDMQIENGNRIIITGRSDVIGKDWKYDMKKEMEILWTDKFLSDNASNDTLVEILENLNYYIEDTQELLKDAERQNDFSKVIRASTKSSADTFKDYYEFYLEDLERRLTEEINAIKIDDDELLELTKKYSNVLKSMQKIFHSSSIKDNINFRKDIKELWESKKYNVIGKTLVVSDNKMYSYIEKVTPIVNHIEDRKIKKVLETQEQDKYKLPFNIKEERKKEKPDELSIMIDMGKNEVGSEQIKDIDFKKLDESIININKYFLQNADEESPSQSTSLKNDDYEVLIFMGAQFLNNSITSVSNFKADKNNKLSESDLADIQLSIGKHPIKDDHSLSVLRRSLIAVPVILGLDVAIDGEADLLQNVLLAQQSLGGVASLVGIELSAAALSTISMGILGVAVSAFVVSQVMKDVNYSQVEWYKNAELLVGLLKESQVENHINSQRAIFERMEQKIASKEAVLRGENELVGQLEECVYIANRTFSKTKKVVGQKYESSFLF